MTRRATPSRRAILKGLAASSVSVLGGCSVGEAIGGGVTSGGPGQAALLLPLSGASQQLGQMLQTAASLGGGPGIGIDIFDTGSSPEDAAAAARNAVDAGANMLIGPVFGAQARAVAAAVPDQVPVVTLSNDASLAGNGLYVFGITPAHSAQAVLSLAAQRNLRDVAVIVPPGAFGAQSVSAVQALAPQLGMQLRAPIVRGDAAGIGAALANGGGTPDAVYLPAADGNLAPIARALSGLDIQLLGSAQWSALDLESDPAFNGAWFAAPDPLRFAPFRDAFAEATGSNAGIIAGLTYDGTELARTLGRQGRQSRRGLQAEDGFSGVLGPYRFLRSGLCQRGLAVLRVGSGDFALIGATSV
ncbi:penicillin-binding protein activator [Roseivivax jejudonensis]|uniref:penicillin-binding protein activator n=1 Tax=Roseivivax jejudonensis TaxID=1529041 RepID=UPI0013564306|nr:penicillin-binding protein activator [Roseivivax jejudonensis]